MVLGLIVDYIVANSSVPEKNWTPAKTSAYKKNSNSNNGDIYVFSKFTFPQSRQHIIVLKLKLKL